MGIGNEKFVRTARRGFTDTEVSFDLTTKKSIDASLTKFNGTPAHNKSNFNMFSTPSM